MKKSENDLYDAVEFEDIRGVIRNVVEKYPDNNAFIIKKKQGKKVEYENITYKRFGEEIDALGTALVNMGLKCRDEDR